MRPGRWSGDTWGKSADAVVEQAEGQVELVRLGERLLAAQEDMVRLTTELTMSQAEARKLEQELGNLREKHGAADSTVRSQFENLTRLQGEEHSCPQVATSLPSRSSG